MCCKQHIHMHINSTRAMFFRGAPEMFTQPSFSFMAFPHTTISPFFMLKSPCFMLKFTISDGKVSIFSCKITIFPWFLGTSWSNTPLDPLGCRNPIEISRSPRCDLTSGGHHPVTVTHFFRDLTNENWI